MAFKTKYTYFLGLSFCQLLDLLDCGKVEIAPGDFERATVEFTTQEALH